MISDNGHYRPAIPYGKRVRLSVQASRTHYSIPRLSGLPLEEYEAVEIGLLLDGHLVRPSQVDIELGRSDELFEAGRSPVAAYVSIEKVEELKAALEIFAQLEEKDV